MRNRIKKNYVKPKVKTLPINIRKSIQTASWCSSCANCTGPCVGGCSSED